MKNKNTTPMKDYIHPLKVWLIEHNKTSLDFARITGLSNSYIRGIYTWHRMNTSKDKIGKLSQSTGIPEEVLMYAEKHAVLKKDYLKKKGGK